MVRESTGVGIVKQHQVNLAVTPIRSPAPRINVTIVASCLGPLMRVRVLLLMLVMMVMKMYFGRSLPKIVDSTPLDVIAEHKFTVGP